MNTASKKSLFFVLLTSLASLTACGGGGGGGGGGALPAPRRSSPSAKSPEHDRQGHLAEDYSNAGDSGGPEGHARKRPALPESLGSQASQ